MSDQRDSERGGGNLEILPNLTELGCLPFKDISLTEVWIALKMDLANTAKTKGIKQGNRMQKQQSGFIRPKKTRYKWVWDTWLRAT
jgi:hypothetical protein